jgi:hypothetical protein
VPRGDLVAQVPDRLRGGADPDQPGVDHRLREGGVLAEEPVAGVDAVGACAAGGLDDLADVEVRLGSSVAAERERLVCEPDEQRIAIRVGVDGNAGEARVTAGAHHPYGDLSSVRDEDLAQARHGSASSLRHKVSAV